MNSIQISNVAIRQTSNNLYNLNDLHRASGGEKRFQPANWLRNAQTVDLINFLKNEELQSEEEIIQSKQKHGTFVCKELAYAYATWISAKFFLLVIRTFDAALSGRLKTSS
ncbi:KilA-N domain-containing protein, partial [Neisseria bacilliformis]